MLLTEIKELVKLLMHVWFYTQSDDHTDYSQAALGSSTQAAPTPRPRMLSRHHYRQV